MASSNYCSKKVNDCFNALDGYFSDSFNDDDEIAAILTLFIDGRETWELQNNANLQEPRAEYKHYLKAESLTDTEHEDVKRAIISSILSDIMYDIRITRSVELEQGFNKRFTRMLMEALKDYKFAPSNS